METRAGRTKAGNREKRGHLSPHFFIFLIVIDLGTQPYYNICTELIASYLFGAPNRACEGATPPSIPCVLLLQIEQVQSEDKSLKAPTHYTVAKIKRGLPF